MTAINSNRAIRGPVTAVPVVAGKGVRLVADTENNRWVVEADETVIFEDTGTTGTVVSSVVLSETASNFSTLEITLGWAGGGSTPTAGRLIFRCNTDGNYYGFGGFIGADNASHFVLGGISANGTSLGLKNAIDMYSSNLSSATYQSFNAVLKVFKVIGINRVANN